MPLEFSRSDGKDLSAFLLEVDIWADGSLRKVRGELRRLKVDLKPLQRIHGTVGAGEAWQDAKPFAKSVAEAATVVSAAKLEGLHIYFSNGHLAADLHDLGRAIASAARKGARKVRLSLGDPDLAG